MLHGAKVGLGAVALALSACGPSSGSRPPTTASPPGPSAASASPQAGLALIAAFDGSGPSAALHLLRLDGTEVAHLARPGRLAGAVPGRLFFSDGRTLTALARDGAAQVVATFPATISSLVVSPAGDQWAWAVDDKPAGTSMTTRVYTARAGEPPRLVTTHTEDGRFLEPLSWTAQGVIVEHVPTGIGGISAFADDFVFATSRLDLGSGKLTDLLPETCHLSATASDGTLACVTVSQAGPQNPTVRFIFPGGRQRDVPLPGAIVDAGGVVFARTGNTVAVGGARALANGQAAPFSYTTFVIDTSSGSARRFGPDGVKPVDWLADGRLIASRPDRTGGAPGTYIVNSDGSASVKVTSYSNTVALLS